MKLYISDGALLLLGLFYLPVVVWLLWMLWKKLPPRLPVRLGVSIAAVLIAMAIPLWDVTITSARMAQLCVHAGIFVQRSVKVTGFLTDFAGEDTLRKGFRFIEYRSGDRITLYVRNGETVTKQEFDANQYRIKSRYELLSMEVYDRPVLGRLIGMSRSIARDRVTGEELGSSLRYTAYPGWLDRNTVGRFGRLQWVCPTAYEQDINFLHQVVQPSDVGTQATGEGARK